MKKIIFCIFILFFKIELIARDASTSTSTSTDQALNSIQAEDILRHIKVLASDDFEGRSPGTKGEALSVDYITEQFKKIGLSPGNPDGSFKESVPLVGITTQPTLSFKTPLKTITLQFPNDFVGFSPKTEKEFEIKKSDLVFVGYGVVAPEYGWDDYKGVDLKGKTILMLINDPAIPDPQNIDKLDPKMFKGAEMTYYGRWTYKFEMAVKMGATAAIIIHETKAAAYPFEVVKNSWSRENFSIQSSKPSPDFPSFAAWIQLDSAKELFKASGLDFETLKKSALSKNFKPVNLGSTVNIKVASQSKQLNSNNVIAKLEGSDPNLKNEYIIYSAHWDHFGIDEKLPGPKTNQIFHGATDNASGVAALLEIAQAYKKLKVAPKRSILFLATTAEERGLLGARYYAQNPLYPLQKTLIDINIDVMNLWGRTKDYQIIGMNKSDIDQIVVKEAAKQNRVVHGESNPERGSFYRADHFEFAKVGVPVLYSTGGTISIDKSKDYLQEKIDAFVAHDYHKVSDNVKSDWDLSGTVEDTKLLFSIGYDVAQGKNFPMWNKGDEFKAKRDAN